MTYKEKTMEQILSYVEVFTPQTTNMITKRAKNNYRTSISHQTVEHLLEELKKRGEIRCYKVGKIRLWQR